MSSSMAMWDDVPSYSPSDYNRPLGGRRCPTACERCGREIPLAQNWNQHSVPKRFCSELCRKRAERARWKAKWKAKGVNKYIGGKA